MKTTGGVTGIHRARQLKVRTIVVMVVYGEAARPRILAAGFDATHDFARVVQTYAGTVHYLDGDPDVRWESWDAVVALGEEPIINAAHLYVLQVGGDPIARNMPNSLRLAQSKPLFLMERVGRELQIADDLDDELRELVKTHLLPLALEDRTASRLRIQRTTNFEFAGGFYQPLLTDLDGNALAALYRPPRGAYECLYLPAHVTDIAPWLLYAFKRWAREKPDVFPASPDWAASPMWMASREEAAAIVLRDRRTEADRVIAEQEKLVADAENELERIREDVEVTDRLLLTGTDEPLVDIVAKTLQEFGFEVKNVDDERRAKGFPLREDLQVSAGDWLSLCEVKGYFKGAKSSDLTKLTTFATLFVNETGKLPSALWYVVNQHRGSDPTSRPLPLRGHEDHIDALADQQGLVIDTRDLFRLRKAVGSGSIGPEAARNMLIEFTGLFGLPEDLD